GADRRLDLRPLVVVLEAHAADGVLELAHALAERPADLREALRSEEEQREQEQQDDLAWADVRHGSTIARLRRREPGDPGKCAEEANRRPPRPAPLPRRTARLGGTSG